MTLADAFTIFVAVGTLGTILLGRLALGASERLSGREVLAGIIALAGVTVIAHGRQTTDALFQRTFASYNTTESDTQPQRQRIRPWSSAAADDHEMPSGPMLLDSGTGSQLVSTSTAVIGVSICIMGGVASAVFNILTRHLSRSDGYYRVSPPVLLAYFMAVVLAVMSAVAFTTWASGLDTFSAWEWTRLRVPSGVAEWILLHVYCAGVLGGQLAMAAGYSRVRSGRAAFIALSELAFAYVAYAHPCRKQLEPFTFY
mmetsp:Transcript_31354/g.95878  ORF Transcript_31354/g.95878 Transcript_31354/m.95878 type:complete len:257 (+) Transcript_31354:261-1031(+)